MRYISGHGRDYAAQDVQLYHDMMATTIGIVGKEMDAGASLQSIQQKDVLKAWESWGDSFISKDNWIGSIHQSLSNQPASNATAVLEPLFEVLKDKDAGAVVDLYYRLKKEQPDQYDFSEFNLNALGYYIMSRNRVQEAIEILKLNVTVFPDAFNVYDSLGEAYMTNGDTELAIWNYKKSVELNPGNTNGIEMLKRLEQSKSKK